jgi:uncharacterized protein YndB with AHSA1/START domain
MPREFEIRKEVELEATPEQLWEAITTASGNAAWFMTIDDVLPDGPGVRTWDPPKRLAVETSSPDGTTQAFEYLIEARGGFAVLRFAHSGVLGDDWNEEFEGMTRRGWDMYLHTLGQYLKFFPGRTATFVSAEAPAAAAGEQAWPVLLTSLGLTGKVAVGDRVRIPVAGTEGGVDYVGDAHLGVRSAEGLYRFHVLTKLGMPLAIGHHLYRDVDAEKTRTAWREWLEEIFA